MSKKNRRKQKEKMKEYDILTNHNALLKIEEYMQENEVTDFSDLPILLRLEHEEWYLTFVKHHAYFKDLIAAQKLKKSMSDMQTEEMNTEENMEETFTFGNETLSMDTPEGQKKYHVLLSSLLEVYPFRRKYADKEDMFYLIQNAGTVIAVCTDKGKAMQIAEGMQKSQPENFYDVCYYESSSFCFEHFGKGGKN